MLCFVLSLISNCNRSLLMFFFKSVNFLKVYRSVCCTFFICPSSFRIVEHRDLFKTMDVLVYSIDFYSILMISFSVQAKVWLRSSRPFFSNLKKGLCMYKFIRSKNDRNLKSLYKFQIFLTKYYKSRRV